MLRWTLDRDNGLAYISLTDERAGGEVTSVDLGELAKEEGIDALHFLVLDFDPEGRLLGIEVLATQNGCCPGTYSPSRATTSGGIAAVSTSRSTCRRTIVRPGSHR